MDDRKAMLEAALKAHKTSLHRASSIQDQQMREESTARVQAIINATQAEIDALDA